MALRELQKGHPILRLFYLHEEIFIQSHAKFVCYCPKVIVSNRLADI